MNGRRWTLTLLFLAVCCEIGMPRASAQNLTDAWVEKAAAPLIANKTVAGLSIGYIEGKHWGIVHLGAATPEGKKPDDATVYEIGSLSKLFTSLLLADAVVRGEIDLQAPAAVANPAGIQLPSREGRSIAWLDLSTHRSGLPRLPTNLALTLDDPYRDYDSKKAAAFLKDYELPRLPGATQEYSNLGASVLGYLVAAKAGKSYEQLLQERIAEPLKMTDCTTALSDEQGQRIAAPHDKAGSTMHLWTFADLPGAGGVHATLRDMMRFAKAQLAPPPGTFGEAIELAWKQQTAADASGTAMGLGWMIAGDEGQTRWHNGQTGGFHASLFINRQFKSAVVVLCNTGVEAGDLLATQLIQKSAGLEPQVVQPAADATAINAPLRQRLVGRYQLTPTFIFDVQDRDGHLMVGITNQPTQEVFPDSPTLWSYRGIDATLAFNVDENGKCDLLVLLQNGLKQTAKRLPDEKIVAVPAAALQKYVGSYELAPGALFTVEVQDGKLMIALTGQPSLQVYARSEKEWFYKEVEATITFQVDKNEKCDSLVLFQNGVKQTAKRKQ